MYTAQGKIDQNAMLEQYLPVVRRQALSLQVKLPAAVELDDLIADETALRQALTFAVACGCVACEAYGAFPSLPEHARVVARMAQ